MHATFDILMVVLSIAGLAAEHWRHVRAEKALKAKYDANLAEWKTEMRVLVQYNSDYRERYAAAVVRAEHAEQFKRQMEERLERLGQLLGRLNIFAVATELGIPRKYPKTATCTFARRPSSVLPTEAVVVRSDTLN